jgi:hypothetical protein
MDDSMREPEGSPMVQPTFGHGVRIPEIIMPIETGIRFNSPPTNFSLGGWAHWPTSRPNHQQLIVDLPGGREGPQLDD